MFYFIFSALLPRSKSTPGLVESTGKITLQNMILSGSICHYTHPRSSRTPRGSSSRSGSSRGSYGGRMDDDTSLLSGHHRSGSVEGPSGSGDLGVMHSGEITHSMTVSSITSYVTDTSQQKSPMGTVDPPAHPSSSSPLPSPPSMAGATYFPASCGGSPPNSIGPPDSSQRMRMDSFSSKPAAIHGENFFGASNVPVTDNTAFTSRSPPPPVIARSPPHISHSPPQASSSHSPPIGTFSSQEPTPSLSPYTSAFKDPTAAFPSSRGAPYAHHPAAGGLLATSQSYPYVPGTTMSMLPTGSASSLPIPDSSQDILLQEITRLRERLQSLEGENASMSAKLNQQKTEVEHRLAEIEMHICGSDSGSCEEEKVGNKESVI